MPKLVKNVYLQEEDIEAWLSHAVINGDAGWLYKEEDIRSEMHNPASAVFIKTSKPTLIGFDWKEDYDPQDTFASKDIIKGWNLIGTGTDGNLKNILSNLRYHNGSGVTSIFAPNVFNSNKQRGYSYNWYESPLDLTDWQKNNFMYRLDGYWIYLCGEDREYSTVIDPGEIVPIPGGGRGSGGSSPSPTLHQ
ncbi:hypothetical protein [Desulfallas thermosapovorans]|uniref:Uncharacterized protein n=1 Tax=Desulfallas thermosapovorans DSM 6562 TaxID=1121431 RepID=A0A5S4ZVU8_9FIRM|nr:hypothetical protein [Desulfallas thermosapovorans]TYO96926.1 hypothetical protein LX24_00736 [Desulfallas thermosapovorans DSM 6562]